MQMSHAGMKMQSLSMMMPVHVFKPQCKYLLAEMKMQKSYGANAPSGYVMMQMSPYRYAMMRMPLCGCVMMQMPSCGCAMM